LALLVAYNVISGEREQGTLKDWKLTKSDPAKVDITFSYTEIGEIRAIFLARWFCFNKLVR